MPRHTDIEGSVWSGLKTVARGFTYPVRKLGADAAWRRLRAVIAKLRMAGAPADPRLLDQAVALRSRIIQLKSASGRGMTAEAKASYREELRQRAEEAS